MKKKNKFLKILGENPKIKMLDFFLKNKNLDYSLTQIAKNSKISYNSLKVFFFQFLKNGILIKTRKIGKSDLYKLNTKNPIVKQIIKVYVTCK